MIDVDPSPALLHLAEQASLRSASVTELIEGTAERWLTPVWCRCAGNCHLDRPTASLVEQSGFSLERIETGYARGTKPMVFMYEGSARPT